MINNEIQDFEPCNENKAFLNLFYAWKIAQNDDF